MNRLKEIETRLAEIKELMNAEDADLDALTEETRSLLDEKAEILKKAEQRTALLESIANGTVGGEGTPAIATSVVPEERTYGAESAEYRSAFFKDLLGEELSVEERAAFVATTANTTAPLPTQTLNQIWDLVTGQHSILGDITIYRTGVAIEVVKHTEIAQGKARKVSENAANDDEKNTFVKVTLSGSDFSKHVDISYAMAKMSIEAFEQYLINEISASLGEALAEDVVATIEAGVNAANKISSSEVGKVGYADMAKTFALLKRVGATTVYASRETIYNYLVAMVDTAGRPIFQPNAQAGAEGTLIGATVKVEDGVAAGNILVGDPKKVVGNMVQDIIIENDKDIKKHVLTYSGYARFEAALIDDKAFAELTVKTA